MGSLIIIIIITTRTQQILGPTNDMPRGIQGILLAVQPQGTIIGISIDTSLLHASQISRLALLQHLQAQILNKRIAILGRELNGKVDVLASGRKIILLESNAGPFTPHLARLGHFTERLSEHLHLS